MIYTRKGSKITVDGIDYEVGGYVIANYKSEYNGLIGVITEIRTGEDKETDNETDDIYVSFSVPEDNPGLIAEIEEDFSEAYGEKKTIDDIVLDEVIMAPDMLKTETVVTGEFRPDDVRICDAHGIVYSTRTAKIVEDIRDALKKKALTIYVVTNMTPTDNYTPMLFSDKRKAINWMLECTANNVIAALEEDEKEELGELVRTDRYKEIIETVQRKGYVDVSVENNRSEINYLDDTFNIMEVFECEVNE